MQVIFAQFPIDLAPNEISEPFIYQAIENNEFLLTLKASTNTNWSIPNSESATLVIAIDGDWENYNQDIVLYAGNTNHEYYVSLGYLSEGEHTIEFKFDSNKSSIGAEFVYIESVDIIDIITFSEMDPTDEWEVDSDVFLHSPILYGRDLLSWNESMHTDIPLLMWHEIFTYDNYKTIKYSIIFSNEDSRVGIGLADLMFSYGRTTDIEWVYEVTLDAHGEIINEIFQGPSHITTNFDGQKIGKHPILKNATLNCNFTDSGTSDYKFFLSPAKTFNGYIVNSDGQIVDTWQTRETLMDDYPWIYRIMAEELINEQRYEQIADPETVEISDVRNYIYIEYYGHGSGDLDLIIKSHDNCKQYYHHHNFDEFSSFYNGGPIRTSIEMPENFNPINLSHLGFVLDGNHNYEINIETIKLFYLDSNYVPVYLPGNIFSSFTLNNNNLDQWIPINNNTMNIDCFGEPNGSAICDDCGVCNGDNIDLDDCGICFGNNMDIDCSGLCFGDAETDDCGVCDSDSTNDNSTCSGCTDINADNYNENAVFYDESCIYSDNIFFVPNEYNTIQDAIFYSSDNDTIEIGEGTYYENIYIIDKSLTLRAESGLDTGPSIVGVDSASTITISDNLNTTIAGITISNGYGNGVSFSDFLSLAADEVAFDSLVTQVLRGGGISIINSNTYLKDLNIVNNISRNVGAGLGLINSSVVIESSSLINNSIPDGDALGGGGIAINGGDVTIIDTYIADNIVGSNLYSLNGGGGILCGFSFGEDPLSLNMYNTTILNNEASVGAGLGALSGHININRSIISHNIGDYGSAISMGEPLGLIVGDINMNVINSTIANNTGLITAGLINSAYLNILNSIFWNNDSDYEFSPMPNNNQLNIEAYYSIFENDFSGEGNINSDPLFSNDSYYLSANSPAIDAGVDYFNFNDDTVIQIDTYYGDFPDLGAYEFEDCFNSSASGDLNNDGILDILDILQAVNMIMGFSDIVDNQFCIVDMNADDMLDIFDIIIMVNIILSI